MYKNSRKIKTKHTLTVGECSCGYSLFIFVESQGIILTTQFENQILVMLQSGCEDTVERKFDPMLLAYVH